MMPLTEILKLAKRKQVFLRSQLGQQQGWTIRDERENKMTTCREPDLHREWIPFGFTEGVLGDEACHFRYRKAENTECAQGHVTVDG